MKQKGKRNIFHSLIPHWQLGKGGILTYIIAFAIICANFIAIFIFSASSTQERQGRSLVLNTTLELIVKAQVPSTSDSINDKISSITGQGLEATISIKDLLKILELFKDDPDEFQQSYVKAVLLHNNVTKDSRWMSLCNNYEESNKITSKVNQSYNQSFTTNNITSKVNQSYNQRFTTNNITRRLLTTTDSPVLTLTVTSNHNESYTKKQTTNNSKEINMKPKLNQITDTTKEINMKPKLNQITDTTKEINMKPKLQQTTDTTKEINIKPKLQQTTDETKEINMKPKLQQTTNETKEINMKPKLNQTTDTTKEINMKPKLNQITDKTKEINMKPKLPKPEQSNRNVSTSTKKPHETSTKSSEKPKNDTNTRNSIDVTLQKTVTINSSKTLLSCINYTTELVGKVIPKMKEKSAQEMSSLFPMLQKGGHYSPKECQPKENTAIIIPFRNRNSHLHILLLNILPLMIKQKVKFTVFVIEQVLPGAFNRAMLFNIGFLEAQKIDNFDCFIFHDVDLIPINELNFYHCNYRPTHFLSGVDKFKYKLMYNNMFGGVVAFTSKQFQRINGASNLYFGWGGEDDDLQKRITQKGFTVQRKYKTIGLYDMIKHKRDETNHVNPLRRELLRAATERQDIEGLNTTRYSTQSVELLPLYTWLKVSINVTEVLMTAPRFMERLRDKLLKHFSL